MTKIFISYRRADAADAAGRMFDRLVAAFGAENVFKDVDSIPLGSEFGDVISDRLSGCKAVIVVIGRFWLAVRGKDGTPRLQNPGDYVRIEIEHALSSGALVIPALVGNVAMPREDQLPECISGLTRKHAISIRPDPDFHRDMDRLVRGLQEHFDQTDSAAAPTPPQVVRRPPSVIVPPAAQHVQGAKQAAQAAEPTSDLSRCERTPAPGAATDVKPAGAVVRGKRPTAGLLVVACALAVGVGGWLCSRPAPNATPLLADVKPAKAATRFNDANKLLPKDSTAQPLHAKVWDTSGPKPDRSRHAPVPALAPAVAIGPGAPRPTEKEKEAVTAIEAIGGRVGRHTDGSVYDVSLSNCGAKDSDLSYVRAFPNLEQLSLIGGEISDAGLASLKYVPTLKVLFLNQDKVTERGIQVIKYLPELTWLSLHMPFSKPFSASAFDVIATCKNLERLEISTSNLLAVGPLHCLREMPSLKDLDVGAAGVTDNDVDDIVKCKTIETLNLRADPISGIGLRKLAELPRLSELCLYGVEALSDGDLPALLGCSHLRKINIRNTNFTEQGIISLKALPSLKVIKLEDARAKAAVKKVFGTERPDVEISEGD